MDIKRKDIRKMTPKTKEWVEGIKHKIKVCETCVDKSSAKKCISDIVNKT